MAPPTGSAWPRRSISPVIATSCRIGRPVKTDTTATVGGVPRIILGTTLETAGGALPNNCGGLNSTLAVGSVTPPSPPSAPGSGDIIKLAAPLPNGQSVDVQLLLGVLQNGAFRFFINVEVLN